MPSPSSALGSTIIMRINPGEARRRCTAVRTPEAPANDGNDFGPQRDINPINPIEIPHNRHLGGLSRPASRPAISFIA